MCLKGEAEGDGAPSYADDNDALQLKPACPHKAVYEVLDGRTRDEVDLFDGIKLTLLTEVCQNGVHTLESVSGNALCERAMRTLLEAHIASKPPLEWSSLFKEARISSQMHKLSEHLGEELDQLRRKGQSVMDGVRAFVASHGGRFPTRCKDAPSAEQKLAKRISNARRCLRENVRAELDQLQRKGQLLMDAVHAFVASHGGRCPAQGKDASSRRTAARKAHYEAEAQAL